MSSRRDKMAREHLANSLQELVDGELKKFKSRLTYVDLKKNLPNIPRGKIKEADSEDLAEILVQYYGSQYALKVTMTVLKKIQLRNLAEMLQEQTLQAKSKYKKKKEEDGETDDDDDDEDETDEDLSDDDDEDDDDGSDDEDDDSDDDDEDDDDDDGDDDNDSDDNDDKDDDDDD